MNEWYLGEPYECLHMPTSSVFLYQANRAYPGKWNQLPLKYLRLKHLGWELIHGECMRWNTCHPQKWLIDKYWWAWRWVDDLIKWMLYLSTCPDMKWMLHLSMCLSRTIASVSGLKLQVQNYCMLKWKTWTLQKHKFSEYTHAAVRMIPVFVDSSNHLFYKPQLPIIQSLLSLDVVLRLRQFGNTVLIGCAHAGDRGYCWLYSAAKSRSYWRNLATHFTCEEQSQVH